MLHKLNDENFIKNKPPSIKDIKLLENISLDTEAYIYEFYNNENGKRYVGYHLDNDEVYWHSSQNDEFAEVFAGNKPLLDLTIIETGSKNWMIHREYEILSNADNGKGAKKSDMWYNGNNGAPRERISRFDLIVKLGTKIDNKEFTIDNITKGELKEIDWYQTRHVALKQEHKNTLKESMELNPNLDEWKPIVLLEDYYGYGKHLGIGGNHTSRAMIDAKHTTYISTQKVPKTEYEDFNSEELRWLGNYLNKIDRHPKEDIEVEDVVYNIYQTLIDNPNKNWWNDKIRKMIDILGFSPKAKKKIGKEVKKLLTEDEARKRGPNIRFKEYSSEEKKIKVTKIQEEYPDNLVLEYSSAQLEMSRPLRQCRLRNTKEVVILIFHNNVGAYNKWSEEKIKIEKDNKFGYNLNIIWKEIDCWLDVSKI